MVKNPSVCPVVFMVSDAWVSPPSVSVKGVTAFRGRGAVYSFRQRKRIAVGREGMFHHWSQRMAARVKRCPTKSPANAALPVNATYLRRGVQ